MPSSDAVSLALRYQRHVARLDATRRRSEAAFAAGRLRSGDLDIVYSGLFLQLIVAYEAAIERFVLGLTVRPGGVASSVKGVGGRLYVKSYEHALSVAAGGGRREYADWMGRQRLEDNAALLLKGGLPFSSVPTASWEPIEKARHIRNAIAHPSKSAREKFESQVIGNTPLPKRERKPPGYLRGVIAGPPTQTRWEVFAANIALFVSTNIR